MNASHQCDPRPHSVPSLETISNVLATVTLRDGQLIAEVAGYEGVQSEVYIQRANPSTILFVNDTDEARRMVVSYGKVVEDLGGGAQAFAQVLQLQPDNEKAIAGMARENSGTVEQTAGAAHDLKRLADSLASLVGRFKV